MSKTFNLVPAKLPEQKLAFTNHVYVSLEDFGQLCAQPSEGPAYVSVQGCIFSLSVDCRIQPGTLGVSELQRRFARISLPNEGVAVKRFELPPTLHLSSCSLEVEFVQPNGPKKEFEISDSDLERLFRESYSEQVLAVGQSVALEYDERNLKVTVKSVQGMDFGSSLPATPLQVGNGVLSSATELSFQPSTKAANRLQILSTRVTRRVIFHPEFNFEEIGIGGLSKEFADIFRRVFAARVCPPHVVKKLGIKHVRGMVLHGPPGTGKTLIARQLAKFLNAVEPKIINGPEVLSKFVGEAESKIRELFQDAEKDQHVNGDNSQLHVIILDEMDAICKTRGSTRDGTGVGDNIVNQMLAKLDGVHGLNNILLIGMTNRLDMIDSGLLRPGRFELKVEISLPDAAGRLEILNIHTASMRQSNFLEENVSMQEFAEATRNFSGAELEGLVKAASASAISRKVNLHNLSECDGFEDLRVTRLDFEHALIDVEPAFGKDMCSFRSCIEHGLIEYSFEFKDVLRKCMKLIAQVKNSENAMLLSAMLAGPTACGKTAVAAHLARKADFPFSRRVSVEDFLGKSEHEKVDKISKIFDDAQKSPLSLVVLDDLERLMDFSCIGPRFSNSILQLFFSILKRRPSKPGYRMLILGTTSELDFIKKNNLHRAFNATLALPVLSTPAHFQAVFDQVPAMHAVNAEELCKGLSGCKVGIRTLFEVFEMAKQRNDDVDDVLAEHLSECFYDAGVFDDQVIVDHHSRF